MSRAGVHIVQVAFVAHSSSDQPGPEVEQFPVGLTLLARGGGGVGRGAELLLTITGVALLDDGRDVGVALVTCI